MGDEKEPAKDENCDRRSSGCGMPAVPGLRAAAEEKLVRTQGTSGDLAGKTVEKLLYELQVHQIELEMQNEELQRAQVALEESRDKYVDLYDYAPVGYFTLSGKGEIAEANLAGAALLGLGRSKLVRRGFGWFVVPEDRDRWDQHLVSVLHSDEKQTCELTLKREGGSTFDAHLDSIRLDRPARETGEGGTGSVIRVAMSDISDLKRAVALRDSEEKYRTLFQTMAQGVVYWGADGKIVSANPAAERILGLSLERKQGHASVGPCRSAIHEDGADFPGETHPAMVALRTGKEVRDVVMGVFDARHQSYVWIRICAVPQFRPGESQPCQAYTTFDDITVRKKAEDDLHKSEVRYRSSIELTGNLAWTTDSNGEVVEDIPIWRNFTGLSVEETKGWGWTKALHPEDAERARQVWTKAVKDRSAYEVEFRLRRFDGVYRDFLTQGIPALLEDGSILEWVGVNIDITERKRAEEALRQSEERYRMLFEGVTEGILATDIESKKFQYANPAVCRMLGYSKEELTSMGVPDIHPKESLNDVLAAFDAQARGRISLTPNLPFLRKDGTVVQVDVTASPVEIGGRSYMVGFFTDVTERKRLDRQVRQAQKMDAVGRLAGGVAHDVRNQLTVIKGYSEMLLRQSLVEGEGRDMIGEILKAVERSSTLARDLLAFGRKQMVRPEVVNLNGLMTAMSKSLAPMIGEDIRLSVTSSDNLGNVEIDPGEFQHALTNIVLNARDAMPKGGRLVIETSNVELDEGFVREHLGASVGPHVMVAVSDSGVGMDGETLERIFEPFFTTKPVGKGSGLGLSMVYGFVKQSNGYVSVYSEPGQGTTFRLYFPRVAGQARSVQEPAQPTPLQKGTGMVLVVEDEEAVRRFVAESLREAGYTVLQAADPVQGISLAEKHEGHIDLLLTDIVMPEMDGSELAQRMKAVRPGMRVLFVSGYTGDALTQRGVLPEDMPLLVKPFGTEQLIQAVMNALRGAEPPEENPANSQR